MNYRKIRMVPTIFFIALFVVSWVSDMLTIVLDTALIYVDPSYLGNIFDATCTVAVLSNAILSLLVGASDQKIMGIPIKIVFNKTDVGIAIWVDTYRGKGIGKLVMQTVIARLKELGFAKITGSTVYQWNTSSQKLHESLGFHRVSEDEKEIVYERHL